MTCILTGFKRATDAGAAYGNTQNVGAYVFSSPTGANGANVPFTLPDFVNGTVPVATYLANQTAAGWSNGMMLQWSATGSCCIPSRTTSIKPYTFTPNTYTHIVNAGLDLSSQISGASANALSSAGTYADESFSASPFQLALGYWGYQPIAAGAAALGVTDASLDEFMATQRAEWTGFSAIQSATYAALIAATPATSTTTGVTAYTSSALAQAQIDIQIAADIAAHAGAVAVGNVVTWNESAGTMLSGAGTITGPTYVDAGTLHATMSMTKDFLGGYDITRQRVKTYTIRAAPSAVPYFTSTPSNQTFGGTLFPYPVAPSYSLVSYADCAAQVLAGAPATFDFFGANPALHYTGNTPGIDINRRLTYANFFLNGIPFGTTVVSSPVETMTFPTFYYIDTSTVSNLILAANAALTASSSMSAFQTDLMWNLPL